MLKIDLPRLAGVPISHDVKTLIRDDLSEMVREALLSLKSVRQGIEADVEKEALVE